MTAAGTLSNERARRGRSRVEAGAKASLLRSIAIVRPQGSFGCEEGSLFAMALRTVNGGRSVADTR